MKRCNLIASAVLLAASAALWFLPSASKVVDDSCGSRRARVVSVDNEDIRLTGVVEYGTQHLVVELQDSRQYRAENELRAQLDIDKKFVVGDEVLVAWPKGGVKEGDILIVRDHYRLGWITLLFVAFVLLLVGLGGWTGAKAVFSFIFSCFAVWKLLIPLCLKGWNAPLVSLITVSALTAIIMYLVAGATKKGIAAFLGAILGVVTSLFLAAFFTSVMHVNGATMPFVQSLLNSGYENLSISDIFIGAVILASSGAVMDLAMDIASAVEEVARHNSSLSRIELMASGMRVGRSVVGTMTTTLLLAYSGGYLTLLMMFAAQGTNLLDFINSTLVSAELVKTLVGSFGLVLVAPFTALVSAWIYRR